MRILVPRLAAVEARVARMVPGAAELELVQRPPVPVRFLHRHKAIVVPAQGGDERLDGTLLAVPDAGGRVREDLLHFLLAVVPLRDMTADQRRAFSRITVVRPVTMIPEGFKVGWLNGFTRNVSAGGLLVAGAGALERGDRLRLRFELQDDEELLDVLARVVRTDDDWGLRGLRLERVDAATQDEIARFVAAHQRGAIAAARARRAG